jgi:nucleoid-associated protein YgaU
MLSSSSRYTTTSAEKDGTSIVIAVRKSTSFVQYSTYTARDGDSFINIATKLFGDPSQYWRVADINPQLKFPDLIPAGETIRIPK